MPLNLSTVLTELLPLGLIGLIRYGAWFIKLLLSSRWRDIQATGPLPYTRVGVAVTVKGEPAETFQEVLEALLREKIDQVCITFDKNETVLMELTDRFKAQHGGEIDIRWAVAYDKGKRKGLKGAIEMVEGMDIIICMDSDTIFGEGVKNSIMHTFSREGIGACTVAQRALNPQTTMQYLFDIRLKLRYVTDIPGQALNGHISCLSGRCSAYLAEPLKEIVGNLTTEQWLGIKKTGGGEDKCLTTFIMDRGYKCAVVVNSTVYTRPESSLRIYISQSLRWARNSWFSDLRALFTRRPWMVRDPILLFYTLDRMMSTFTLIFAAWAMLGFVLTQQWQAAFFLFLWWVFSRAIKISPWLLETRKFWVVFPYTVVTFWLSFVKIHALVTLWETGWLTREAGKSAREFSKFVMNNAYRFVTAAIVAVMGIFLFHNQNIWLADMPVIAELGNFYRPGDDGLLTVQDVTNPARQTLIVMNAPINLKRLNNMLPTLTRLGDELKPSAQNIRVIESGDLTEEMAKSSNLIFIDRPEGEGVVQQVAHLYTYPRLGEGLLNTEPFATSDVTPIRVAHAPWDDNEWIILTDSTDQMYYRMLGENATTERVLSIVANDLGSAFFDEQPAITAQSRELATFDASPPLVIEPNRLIRDYQITLPPGMKLTDLMLAIQVNAFDTLLDGTTVDVTLDGQLIESPQVTTTVPEPIALMQSSSDMEELSQTGNTHSLRISIPVSGLRDTTLSEAHVWRQFEANTAITWSETMTSTVNTLDTYPYPYLSLEQDVPLVVILPDSLTDNDINMIVQLAIYFGANGQPYNEFYLMQSSNLDEAVLATANVIVVGQINRQPFVQKINAQFQENDGLGITDILPNLNNGFVWTKASPWNNERSMIIATAASDEGEAIATSALFHTGSLTREAVSGVIVDASGAVTPFGGFDRIVLESLDEQLVAAQ